MTPPPPDQSVDITAAPRAILRESVRLLYRVLGEKRLGTAQGNAWAAICADRERASERAEVSRLMAAARKPAPADRDLKVMINGIRDRRDHEARDVKGR